MRKLVYSEIEKHFILDNKIHYQVIMENTKEYYNFMNSAKTQVTNKEEGCFVLSKDSTLISLHKYLHPITDIFTITDLDRKVKTHAYNMIHDALNESEIKEKFYELITNINQFVFELKNIIDFDVDFNDEMDIKNLLKTIDFSPILEKTSFLEILVSYIKLNTNLFGYNIYIVDRLHSVLTTSEIDLLIKEMNYLEVNLIFVESTDHNYINSAVETIIIDNDLCEIHK